MRPTRILAACLASVLALHVTSAHACSCRMTRAHAIKASDIVFQGRVTSVHADRRNLYASMTVIRPIKGSVRTTIEIGTRRQSAACGYPFRPGQVLIVGASFREQQYRTNSCVMHNLNKRKR